MEHYAGIDVSLKSSSVCVVDASGRIVREDKVASEPEALIGWFGLLGVSPARIGLEAGAGHSSSIGCDSGNARFSCKTSQLA
jgi:transposase